MYADLNARLPSNTERWHSEAFAAELADWIMTEVGPVRSLEPAKLRVWAGVWRAETAAGVHYAKQNCQLQSFEAALAALLVALAPHHVVPVTATDPGRGLLLTPDQGPVFAETGGEDLDTWRAVLAAAAQLQREVAPALARLSEAGLTTIGPADAPSYLDRRVTELASRPAEDPMSLAHESAQALAALRPTVTRWVDRVASLGLPVTLNHGDLHAHNVFHVAGELRFFDFADSLLTEPLGALLIPLNVLARQLDAGPDDARLWRVVEPALEVWSDLAPMPALRAALPAALQLSRLARVESWARCCVSMNDAELAEWGDAVPGWLETLLADPPLGTVED
jgi:Ser/Thr protein kinase RdoA (MazF antagonist)